MRAAAVPRHVPYVLGRLALARLRGPTTAGAGLPRPGISISLHRAAGHRLATASTHDGARRGAINKGRWSSLDVATRTGGTGGQAAPPLVTDGPACHGLHVCSTGPRGGPPASTAGPTFIQCGGAASGLVPGSAALDQSRAVARAWSAIQGGLSVRRGVLTAGHFLVSK